jgi:hypothetical protein
MGPDGFIPACPPQEGWLPWENREGPLWVGLETTSPGATWAPGWGQGAWCCGVGAAQGTWGWPWSFPYHSQQGLPLPRKGIPDSGCNLEGLHSWTLSMADLRALFGSEPESS